MPSSAHPTTPDLVVLSLLAEKPRHGYELNQELERRDVRDWAGISRPQVYYSLSKLARRRLIRPLLRAPGREAAEARGPEREVYAITAAGKSALGAALRRPEWAEQRPPPPFLTWLALSSHAGPDALRAQVKRRRQYLAAELERERKTLAAFDPRHVAAELMVRLTIRQFEVELEWLDEVERRL